MSPKSGINKKLVSDSVDLYVLQDNVRELLGVPKKWYQ